ncbi:isoleucine--tRNA ligase [Chromobacterium sp. IIBBL 290-4]|uniref:isoleucine--tRNA ligase n=1 Tax=Chromobacterium sp. IIBBL 290-4 TaxID=2953890 RepID=UPI0020B886FF|nr:isoleucine--tRNA ligase [Chromobacterium sp. IIBBL 290-4]UTH76447.1 isoleucine--tRNA ligase [Chromobacterium sp. IIBBL 290-4]
MSKEVSSSVNFPKMEEAVQARWEREKTFERSISQREGKPVYVFYDGPPFATGLPHYGHILTSYIKDVIPRYRTMRGHQVPRRWGWDCHGLPVEFEVEKALGFKSKREILDYGVGNFNQACQNLVLKYADEWRAFVNRMGRWVDFDGAYKTMDNDYMESVLWGFKTLHDRGHVYEGSKIVPYCARCQTVLSNFEARLDDAFRPKRDMSAYVKFPVIGADKTYFVAWTTTPWTLPSNVALAVSAEMTYVCVEHGGERLWMSEESIPRVLDDDFGIIERCSGMELSGRRFLPVIGHAYDPEGHPVLTAGFVVPGDGSGIVHIAPAYGEEDASLAAKHGLAAPNPVRDDGTFSEAVAAYAGQNIFDASPRILSDLEQAGTLLKQTLIEHNYPHCWRCDNPLIYRAVESWFVRVSAFRDQLVENNAQINWIPEHVKEGRFGDWLRNARDWAVSRNRFWGAPIPVWRCDCCNSVEVLGSIAEIEARSGRKVHDLHVPHIDEHRFACKSCNGTMSRVSGVFDCWFESGSMPFASRHYPFENKQEFEQAFPSDFIVEYLAQTRGWFYTLVAISTGCFDSHPFKNAMCHGVILAKDGRKMSKRLKNYPNPMDLMDTHGSDALRVALLASPVCRGEDIKFNEESVRDVVRRYHLLFWNCMHFYRTFAEIDGFKPQGCLDKAGDDVLDHYLLHELASMQAQIEEWMEEIDFAKIYARIELFINVLSTWYLRLNKPRIWREGFDDDKRQCYEVLHYALSTFAKLIAPFMPFLAEAVYAELGYEESVHLQHWPEALTEYVSPSLAEEMGSLRSLVGCVRNIRETHAISQRIPLQSIRVAGVGQSVLERYAKFLQEELNVKQVHWEADGSEWTEASVVLRYPLLGKRLGGKMKEVAATVRAGEYVETEHGTLLVAGEEIQADEFERRLLVRPGRSGVGIFENAVVWLDLTITPELRHEGAARELNRRLQDLRKKATLGYSERVEVAVIGGGACTDQILESHESWLKGQLLAVNIHRSHMEDPLVSNQLELVDGEDVMIQLRRVACS